MQRQPTETGSSEDSSSEEDNSDYVVNEGDETSKVAKASDDYCVRVHNMDLYRCTECVFMHRFPSKVRRHYFYKHAKCYPYKCGHCTFEAVESGKIKRHCVLMHDLLPIKVIKRRIDNDPMAPTEDVVMSDVRHENVDIIDDDATVADDTDNWIEAFIAKTSNDNHQQCRICGYVQMGASSVKRHVLAVHLKFYPYGCRYCSYAQVELNKVKKHIEHSHPGRPCTVVKRKLGVPPAEFGDDDATQSGDVTEKDDREPSTGEGVDYGRTENGVPGGRNNDNVSVEASIDEVMKQLLDSISDTPSTDASKGVRSTTVDGKEGVEERGTSDASDVARRPDGIAEETFGEVTMNNTGEGNELNEIDDREESNNKAKDQTSFLDQSFQGNDVQYVRDATDQIFTGPADVVQRDPIGISDIKNNVTSDTDDHDFEPCGDNSICPLELGVDISASATTESSTREQGVADATDSSIGTREDGDSGSVGSLMTSSTHRGDDQSTEGAREEAVVPQEPSSHIEGHTSSEVEAQSSDGKCDDQLKEAKDKAEGQDKQEGGRLVLKLSIPREHRRDVGSVSDEEEDGASGNDDSDEECVDLEADGDDTDKTDTEDAVHIPCSDSSLAPQAGQSQTRTDDNVLGDVVEGAGQSSKSSPALMALIKQEPSASVDGQGRHREDPILSVFAKELAETAMKREHVTPNDVAYASDPEEQVWPITVKHVSSSSSSLKQRRVFLCVYCEYRSMYSPSDVRKHIFAVHMRRYPYRCSYCPFQNMKKFSVEKHTKKSHSGRPISVSEAPVFRDNITVLESQGNRVNVGVVDDKGIPVLDADLLGPLLHKLDPSPSKDIPGKKWTRRSPVPPAPLHFDLRSDAKTESSTVGVSQWRCTECGMQAEVVDRVHVHVLTRHLKLRPYQCAYCEWGTWKTTPVEEHIRLKHPSETLKVLNNVCEKLSDIQKYVEEIPALKPVIAPTKPKMILEVPIVEFGSQLPTMHCDLCPYTASSQSRLQKHRKTHFCYRPFGCFHCEYTSFSQFKVRCHSSRVHKDKQVMAGYLTANYVTDMEFG